MTTLDQPAAEQPGSSAEATASTNSNPRGFRDGSYVGRDYDDINGQPPEVNYNADGTPRPPDTSGIIAPTYFFFGFNRVFVRSKIRRKLAAARYYGFDTRPYNRRYAIGLIMAVCLNPGSLMILTLIIGLLAAATVGPGMSLDTPMAVQAPIANAPAAQSNTPASSEPTTPAAAAPAQYNGLPPMEPGETFNAWMDRVGYLLPPELTTPYVYELGRLDEYGLPFNTYVRPVDEPRPAVASEPGSTTFGVPFAPAVGEIAATTYDINNQVIEPHNYFTPVAGEALDDPSLVPYSAGSGDLDEYSAAEVYLSLLQVGRLAICTPDGTSRQDLSYLPYAYGSPINFSDEYTLWFMSDLFGGQGCATDTPTDARAVQVSPNEFYLGTNFAFNDDGVATADIDRLVRFDDGWKIVYGGRTRY